MKGVRIQRVGRYQRHQGVLSHDKTFKSIGTVLPPTLGRTALYIKDQGTSDYCTAFARSTFGSYLYGIEMSEEWQTAKEGQVVGSPIFDGTDPADADKASNEYGFLPKHLSPLSFAKDGFVHPAQWNSYPPELDDEALKYNPGDPYDVQADFDAIKTALFQGKNDDAIVIANGFWYPAWNNIDGSGIAHLPKGAPLTRHSYAFIDFTSINGVEYLVAQLSQGTNFAAGGIIFFSREVFTYAWKSPVFNGIGCEMFHKTDGQNAITLEISLYKKLIQLLGEYLTQYRIRV